MFWSYYDQTTRYTRLDSMPDLEKRLVRKLGTSMHLNTQSDFDYLTCNRLLYTGSDA
jgi:hypothetical protein